MVHLTAFKEHRPVKSIIRIYKYIVLYNASCCQMFIQTYITFLLNGTYVRYMYIW